MVFNVKAVVYILYLKRPFAELVSWNFLTRTNENYHYIR